MKSPSISVVMPVYNGSQHLVDAVASIVEQTYTDWELICVDDGSTDRSPELLDWMSGQDERIRIFRQENTGIVGALNLGCAKAQSSLIARMDCDDIALPDRLLTQKEYLDANSDCVVIGGAILEIDEDGDPMGLSSLPASHREIEDNLLHRRTGHFHPTTMFRTEAFKQLGGYRRQYQWVEDHDLWLRFSRIGQLANLSKPLLCYRQHSSSVCWQRSDQQRLLMNDLLDESYRERGLVVPEHLLLATQSHRSQAGPGKWSRAAAKGGYVRSTTKHLRRLWCTESTLGYKVRMTVESSLRLVPGALRRFSARSTVEIPKFATWQRHASAFLQALEKQCPQLEAA